MEKIKTTQLFKGLFILTISGIALFSACKKKEDTKKTTTTPPKVSQKALLCKEWTLFETWENDVKKTSNGTGKYRFTTDGQFQYFTSGSWNNVGTWNFNDKDSNSLSVLFSGASMSYWWYIKTLNSTNFNTEFNISGTKYNYNYTR